MSEYSSSIQKILNLRERFLLLSDKKKALLQLIDENEIEKVFEQIVSRINKW